VHQTFFTMSGTVPLAGLGMVADPREGRKSVDMATGGYANRALRNLHDPHVAFEEYLYYAQISRADEMNLYGPGSNWQETPGPISRFFCQNHDIMAEMAGSHVTWLGEAGKTPLHLRPETFCSVASITQYNAPMVLS
jgi:hypothetical protein